MRDDSAGCGKMIGDETVPAMGVQWVFGDLAIVMRGVHRAMDMERISESLLSFSTE
jgi:hypothetical protein